MLLTPLKSWLLTEFIRQSCFKRRLMGRRRGIDFLLDCFFPRRCPVCDCVLKSGEKICRKCENELKWIKGPRCFRCGKPVEEETEYCYDCSREEFHYIRGFSLWLYEGAAKKSVAAFKYKGRQEYAAFYGEELKKTYGEVLKRLRFDRIIPVPVHREKKRLRGYNQAELIARELSGILQVPMEEKALIRIRSTKPQKGLSPREREKNLRKAFRFDPERCRGGRPGRVLLVDDIYTTGSTIEACTISLLAAGVKEVYFITLCIGRDIRR